MAPTIYEHKDHTNATITYLQESYDLTTYLRGAYNISNILAAMSALVLIGIDIAPMIETITDIESVDGRMQEYEHE
jgi:UDP-N-acetylmuramoyl-L-alanyl-D-glutamate--2,6-diaminopimelate ligase